jgi:hypothetical protein
MSPKNENPGGGVDVRFDRSLTDAAHTNVKADLITVLDFPGGRMKRPAIMDRVPEDCEEYLCRQFEQALSIVASESEHCVRAERVVDVILSMLDKQDWRAFLIHVAVIAHKGEATDFSRKLRAQQRGYRNYHVLCPSPSFFKKQRELAATRKKYAEKHAAARKVAKLKGSGV